MIRTNTKTYILLNDWASTIPRDCRGCGKPHVHAGDLCAVPRCGQPMPANETVYAGD